MGVVGNMEWEALAGKEEITTKNERGGLIHAFNMLMFYNFKTAPRSPECQLDHALYISMDTDYA